MQVDGESTRLEHKPHASAGGLAMFGHAVSAVSSLRLSPEFQQGDGVATVLAVAVIAVLIPLDGLNQFIAICECGRSVIGNLTVGIGSFEFKAHALNQAFEMPLSLPVFASGACPVESLTE